MPWIRSGSTGTGNIQNPPALDGQLGKSEHLFQVSQEVRRLIHTTNAIEGFNRLLRKVTKTKSVFPTDGFFATTVHFLRNSSFARELLFASLDSMPCTANCPLSALNTAKGRWPSANSRSSFTLKPEAVFAFSFAVVFGCPAMDIVTSFLLWMGSCFPAFTEGAGLSLSSALRHLASREYGIQTAQAG